MERRTFCYGTGHLSLSSFLSSTLANSRVGGKAPAGGGNRGETPILLAAWIQRSKPTELMTTGWPVRNSARQRWTLSRRLESSALAVGHSSVGKTSSIVLQAQTGRHRPKLFHSSTWENNGRRQSQVEVIAGETLMPIFSPIPSACPPFLDRGATRLTSSPSSHHMSPPLRRYNSRSMVLGMVLGDRHRIAKPSDTRDLPRWQ